MSRVITKDNPLRPTASKAETKADITDRTARIIIGAGCEGNTGQASPRKGCRATASPVSSK